MNRSGYNLRTLFEQHPELIATRYEAKLLPGRNRLRMIGQELRDIPGYEKLPQRFRERIDFAWAPYSEVRFGGTEYDPTDPRHQTPRMQSMLEDVFTRGFRKGVQNQSAAQHDGFIVQRNIAPLVARAEILNPDILNGSSTSSES